MTFLDQETLDLFGRTVRGVLGEEADDSTARLEEVGWRDILATDARAVVPLVFRLQGELRSRSAALDDVALEAMQPGSDTWLAELADAAYVHPAAASRAAGALDATQLVVDGFALRDARDGRLALVATSDAGPRFVLAPVDAFTRVPVAGIDPSMHLVRVTGAVARGTVDVRDGVAVDGVEANCRRALAYELVGLGSAMLALTADYAGVRQQYGHPIGTFQAVKHRLADVLVALRAAEVVADESWDSEPTFMATAAKCLAGRGYHVAAENCLQVMGAIGFTWEHDLHRFIRRGMVLDALLGTWRDLRVELGRALIAAGRVPRPGVL